MQITLQSDITSSVPTTIRTASKYLAIPLTLMGRDQLLNINPNYRVPLDDDEVLPSLAGDLVYLQTGEPTMYGEDKFEGLRNDLGKILEIVNGFNDPQVEEMPEVKWLRQTAEVVPGQPQKYYVFDAIEFVVIGSSVWSDYYYQVPVDFIESLHSAMILIDQSIGYINSNPVLSVLIHDGTQPGNHISLRDTHELTQPEKIWADTKSRGIEYLNDPDPYGNPVSSPKLAQRQTFFQFNPALALVYLDHYCNLLEVE